MNCAPVAGRCCGASARRGWHCAAGDLELDRLEHTARRGGQPVELTNKEFALLEHLMLNRGQCVSRVELLDSVWNMEPAQTTNIVDVYINYLRRKLKDPPPGRLIRTVRGQGYMVPSEAELAIRAGQLCDPLAGRCDVRRAARCLPVPPPGDASAIPSEFIRFFLNSLRRDDADANPSGIRCLPRSPRCVRAPRWWPVRTAAFASG